MKHDMEAKRIVNGVEKTYTQYLVEMIDFLDREDYTDEDIVKMSKLMYLSMYGNYDQWDQEYYKWIATDWNALEKETGVTTEKLLQTAKNMFEIACHSLGIAKVSQLPHIKEYMEGTL